MTLGLRLIEDEATETIAVDVADADAGDRPTTVELLRTITREEPESIREAARLVDRDVRQVHDNLWELGQLGVVEFDRGGRAHRPVVPYDRIEVALEL